MTPAERPGLRTAGLLVSLPLLALTVSCLFAARSVPAEMTGQERARDAGRALIGKPAPRLVRKTIDGDPIDLGALYGRKAVYLKFWATWCVPCRQQMPHFEHAYETAGPDLAVVAIDVGFNDSPEAVRAYREKLGIRMPIVFDDGSLGNAFNVRVTPTHVVIDREGRVRYIGHLADADLDAALVAARSSDAAGSGAMDTSHGAASSEHPAAVAGLHRVAPGERLPALELHTVDGATFALRGGAEGSRTALVFMSPWCESYLEKSRPESSASCKAARLGVEGLAADSHLRWLGIASGLWADEDALRKYRQDHGVSIPLSLDASGHAFHRLGINDVPTVVIAAPDGRILRRVEAAEFKDADSLRRALQSLEKAVP